MGCDPHTKNDHLLKDPSEFVDFAVSEFHMHNSCFRSYAFFDIGHLRSTFVTVCVLIITCFSLLQEYNVVLVLLEEYVDLLARKQKSVYVVFSNMNSEK
jgi:hypothetical protein